MPNPHRFFIALISLLTVLAACAGSAPGHPLSQGSLDIVVTADKVAIHARVTVEETRVVNSSTGIDPTPGPWAAEGTAAFERHAEYLAAHLHLRADGSPLVGKVVNVLPPGDAASTLAPAGASQRDSAGPGSALAEYDLEYALPTPKPHLIEIMQDVLADGHFAPGQSWDATYVVRITQAGQAPLEGVLLTRGEAMNFLCQWTPTSAAPQSGDESGLDHHYWRRVGGQVFEEYFHHGVWHILTGYDHLLFISALVLASRTLWDLVKVVTAFTLAHTLTLTLATLNIVHVSERVSEPLISLSIVFIALQNVIWPKQSSGWTRLAAAFFFGLFHGLGFAGGLLEAMRSMSQTSMLIALAAFSLGVEAGHQLIVIPLFAAMKLARQPITAPADRDRLSLQLQRFGSAAISLAGLYFLVLAMRLCITGQE